MNEFTELRWVTDSGGLVTRYLVEYSADRGIDRSYIKTEKTQEAMERNRGFLQAQAAN